MKKILLIFVISLLCIGCGKQEKNITINIYENSDKSEVKVTEETIEKKSKQTKTEQKENKNTSSKVESNDTNTKEEQPAPQYTTETSSDFTLDKAKNKVTSTYNSAKNWYDNNKDELKDINSGIVEEDKNTINDLIDKGKNWYNENKDPIKEKITNSYNSDKETLEDLYNKLKN